MKKIKSKLLKEESKLNIPNVLRRVLKIDPKVEVLWNKLTPIARRDFISWIDSAKQPETRTRRIAMVPSMLMSGKRRPCCYAVIPMNFYKALAVNPKAKSYWRDLTPVEKRDFVSWVESAKDPDIRADRVNKSCEMLALGKRRP